jgi:hypothetical protein
MILDTLPRGEHTFVVQGRQLVSQGVNAG